MNREMENLKAVALSYSGRWEIAQAMRDIGLEVARSDVGHTVAECEAIKAGTLDAEDNPVKMAPHTEAEVCADEWKHPYSRTQAGKWMLNPSTMFARYFAAKCLPAIIAISIVCIAIMGIVIT